MPIEELLKLYGYNNSQKDTPDKLAQPEKKEDSDQEEIVEPHVEVEPPQEIAVEASKEKNEAPRLLLPP